MAAGARDHWLGALKARTWLAVLGIVVLWAVVVALDVLWVVVITLNVAYIQWLRS